MSSPPLHRDIILHVSPSAYAFSTPSSTLIIHRPNGEISFGEKVAGVESQAIAGILGILRLQLDKYIIIVTKARQLGRLRGHVIYELADWDILPVRDRPVVDPNEQIYLSLIRTHLSTGKFYFSYTYDISNALQRQVTSEAPLWQRFDDRFFWNRYVLSDLIDYASSPSPMDGFILPVMYGFVEIRRTIIKGSPLTFSLISRRSRYRAGTRYFSRGINQDGHVSNFNETEQLVFTGPNENTGLSFVQTRGSVPVHWAEITNLQYKPSLRILGSDFSAATLHFQDQIKRYGKNICVNLVNQSGHELPVKNAYESAVQALEEPGVKYIYFDFHHECKGMRWDRVQILIDEMKGDLVQGGYFWIDFTPPSTGDVRRQQTAVVRTNCMDCLDRTNVVQSALARWTLTRQLQELGILSPTDAVAHDATFELMFRNIWADNADVVSRTYSGTGALKTDFTRFGKRTPSGAFQDFLNSAIRYFRNNFADGPRQDAFDLFLGNFLPFDAVASPFTDHRPLVIQAIPYVFFAAVFMILAALLLPRASDHGIRAFVIFWLVAAGVSLRFLIIHGVDYVNWPKLVPLEFLDTSTGRTKRTRSSSRGRYLEEGKTRIE